MDHMLSNNFSVPTALQLKNYGHKIIPLYDECVKLALNNNLNLPKRVSFINIDQQLLKLPTDFAQTTGYYNLDALSTKATSKDPLEHWAEITLLILKQDVSKKQRDKILGQAKIVSNKIDDISITIMAGMDKQVLSTKEALALPGLDIQAVKYAVFHLIGLLAPIRDLISELSHKVYGLGDTKPPFPQMQEFLEWMWDDRQYILRKKKWS